MVDSIIWSALAFACGLFILFGVYFLKKCTTNQDKGGDDEMNNGNIETVDFHKPEEAYHFIYENLEWAFRIPQNDKIAESRKLAAKLYDADEDALLPSGHMRKIQQFSDICKYLLSTAYGAHLYAFDSGECADLMNIIRNFLSNGKFLSRKLSIVAPPNFVDKQFSVAELERQRCRRLLCNMVAHFILLPDGMVDKKIVAKVFLRALHNNLDKDSVAAWTLCHFLLCKEVPLDVYRQWNERDRDLMPEWAQVLLTRREPTVTSL